MELQPLTLHAIKQHAAAEFPRECCGYVMGNANHLQQWYKPCRNISEKPTELFTIHPEDSADAEDHPDGIRAVVHSHPNESANPTQADIVACEKSGYPWVIIGWPSEVIRQIELTGYKAPLLGREFSYGVLDCYSLIKDALQEFCSIEIPDYYRHKYGWWKEGQNLYLDLYENTGFVKVNSLEKYDILLLQIASPVPNHAAIHIGDGIIMHHLEKRVSCTDVYGGYWKKHTYGIYRHKDLIK